ncbi:MAG: MFS transporter [candidate division WOR-3 bacterium]
MQVLKEKNLLLITIAQSISLFGDRLNNMALLGIIGSYYAQSTLAFSGLAIFIALPSILFSPISGIIADSFNRKKLMIIIEILRAIIVFSIPFVFLNFKNILLIYFMIFLLYSLTLPFNNAKMASIPQMSNNIYTANALLNITGRLSIAIGILFGGILVDLYIWKRLGLEGWQVAFYIDALTYLISAFLILFITMDNSKNYKHIEIAEIIEKERGFLKNLWNEFLFGIKYVLNDVHLSLIFKFLILTMLIISLGYNIYLPYFQQSLGFGTKGIGLIGGSLGIGFLCGSILFPILALKFKEFRLIFFSHFFLPILFIISLFVKNLMLLLILFFIGGFVLSPLLISYDTSLQKFSDDNIRGRLFSFKEFLWSFSFLAFVFLFGIIGEFLKVFISFEDVIKIIIISVSIVVIVLNFLIFKHQLPYPK